MNNMNEEVIPITFQNMFKEVDRYDWKEKCSYCQCELEMSNGHGRCPRCNNCISCGD